MSVECQQHVHREPTTPKPTDIPTVMATDGRVANRADEKHGPTDEERRVDGGESVAVEVVDQRDVLESESTAVPVNPDHERDAVIERTQYRESDRTETEQYEGRIIKESRPPSYFDV